MAQNFLTGLNIVGDALSISGTSAISSARHFAATSITASSSTNRSIILDYTGGSGTYRWTSFKQSGTDQFRIFGEYTSNYLSFYNDQASVHQLKLNSDGSTTFAGDVTVESEHLILKDSSPELYFHTTGNHVNWLIAAQECCNATLEFGAVAASTSLSTDASTYTPILKLAQSGTATFAGTITVGGDITATGADFTLAHAAGATIFLRRDDTSISDGNVLGLINFQGDDPTDGTFNTGVALMGKAAGDWASGSYESEFILQTRNTSGGLVTALTVNEAQNATFAGTVTATHFHGDGSNLTGVTGEWDGTHTGTAVITGDLKVTGSSEDLLAIASQSAGSGTIIMSMNGAENAYEPLRFDAETFKVTASGGTSPCIISTAGLNTTFGGTVTAAHTLDLTSDGTSAWTNSRVTLNATQANSRGAGIFMHNTVADKEFYAGVPYDSSFDKWMVGYASTASHADSTAAPGTSVFEVNSSGNATFGGTVEAGGTISQTSGNILGRGYLNLQNGYGSANGIYLYGNPAMYREDANTLFFPLRNISIKNNGGGNTKFVRIWNTGTADGDDAVLSFTTQSSRTYSIGTHRDSGAFLLTNADASVASGELLTIDNSGNATFAGHVSLADGKSGRFGDSDDLKLYHASGASYIENDTGDLNIIQNNSSGEMIFTQNNNDGNINFNCDDGSNGVTTYISLDGGDTRINVYKSIVSTNTIKATNTITAESSSSNNANVMAAATGTGYAGFYGDAADGDFSGGDYFSIRQLNDLTVEFDVRTNAGVTKFYSKGALNLTQDGTAATFTGTVTASGLTTTGVTNNFTHGTSWGTNLQLTNTNDDASPSTLTFLKDPASGYTTLADNDYVGFINFRAKNSNNDIFSWVELLSLIHI